MTKGIYSGPKDKGAGRGSHCALRMGPLGGRRGGAGIKDDKRMIRVARMIEGRIRGNAGAGCYKSQRGDHKSRSGRAPFECILYQTQTD